ncbi:heat-labile enterotoxin alpha chain domain-containing protein [Hirsutella rhossiliensis]|uniref:Heat-labile enterotoxin alpha chain domain-containing protein n=1 Tax=Hirsutella rhossiliensis TaxID=111463 RepID=A0A9P8MZ27_9HYPO|nr:heat-labile enterotoxin alpha chain domain-containing protein [Hirsutella rhossiliensis]KAH0963885.1 heat-labile enterotoxin alpha chain domain-containing protein [Hirsutella rhossiliensis]
MVFARPCGMAVSVALLWFLLLGWGYARALIPLGMPESLDLPKSQFFREDEVNLVRRAQDGDGNNTDIKHMFVWRGDDRDPETIQRLGGFSPVGDYADNEEAFNIRRHTLGAIRWMEDNVDDSDSDSGDSDSESGDSDSDSKFAHVTNEDYRKAFKCGWSSAYVPTAATSATVWKYSWIYLIRATPNIVEESSVFGEGRDTEAEFSALGGVLWSQVVGHMTVDTLDSLRQQYPDLIIPDDVAVQNIVQNRQYDEERFRNSFAAPPSVAVGATPEGRPYFNSRQGAIHYMGLPGVGDVVGWTGHFPLLPVDPSPPQAETCPANDSIPGPSTSVGQGGQAYSEDDIIVAAEFLQENNAPCALSSLDPRTQFLILEADAAIARALARLDQVRPNETHGTIDEANEAIQAIVARMRQSEEQGTCNLVAKCSSMKQSPKRKRAIDGARLAVFCEKSHIPKNITLHCDTAKGFNCKGKKPQKARKPQGPVDKVFYGSFLWPEEAKKQGGFLPPSATPPGPTYDVVGAPEEPEVVYEDFAAYLLPTFQSLGAAARHASQLASKETGDFEGVVYAVHATPNMVSTGKESAAVGGILWSQVMGWMQVPRGYEVPDKNQTPKQRAQMQEHFRKAFAEKVDLFTPNKNYDDKFNQFNATTQVPDKMDTPQDLIGFMNKNGQAVGWNGGFPLIGTDQVVKGSDSKTAKTNKAVAAPHEPGFFEQIGNFVKAHPIAIALLPVVAIANLFPGLGQVADAAEVAALTAEGAEAIELTEVGGSTLANTGKGIAQILQNAAKLKVE